MAYSGQILDNPVSGERITFHETAADSDGALLSFELELSPGGQVPGLHVHPKQEERFEVLAGTMKFRKGMRTIVAQAGDIVTVEPGKAHKFSNAGDDVAVCRVEVRPALRMEKLLETAVSLAEEGRTTSKGMPKPLDFALFVDAFKNEVRGPYSPGAMQRAALAPLAWAAKRRGHAAIYRPGGLAYA